MDNLNHNPLRPFISTRYILKCKAYSKLVNAE